MKQKKSSNYTSAIATIVYFLIFGIGSSLAIISGILLGSLYPKLDVNKPLLIKAYELVNRQEVKEKEIISIENNFLFNQEETEISQLGEQVLNDLINELETKQVSTIRIASYLDSEKQISLKFAEMVKQYLAKGLEKKSQWIVIAYGLETNTTEKPRIEIILD